MALQPVMHGNHYMVSSGHHLATQAGFAMLEDGGNAVDAGVAAGITLGVVHSDMVQFSGVAPIMIYVAAENRVVTVSGLGGWPQAASLQHFREAHGGEIPHGLLRTVVPGAPDAWIRALDRFGTRSFADVARAAIRLAREGFPMHHVMRDYIVANAENYARWPSNAAIFLPGGRPPAIGERFVQRDLASMLQFLADEETAAGGAGRSAGLAAARNAFYRGDIAARIAEFHRDHGGWLSRDDLAAYESETGTGVKRRVLDVDLYTCEPWCQGPVLHQMAALLDGVELKTLGHNSPEYIHTIAEAMKLAFADREAYYGDPNFVDVPLEHLLSEAYNRERRHLIDRTRAYPGLPPAGAVGPAPAPATRSAATGAVGMPADTSYCCAVDAAGNLFSATPSDVSWESPVIPGLGLCPSARGSQSWAVPGHPSSLAPGKRPRLTPNPAIAIVPGAWSMPFGTPGGDNQPQAMLQVLLNVAVFGMPVQDAIEAPRFMTHSQPNSFSPHHSVPGRLTAEGRIEDGVLERLRRLGHEVESLADFTYQTAGVCAVVRDAASGLLEGGADPRRTSRAMGW